MTLTVDVQAQDRRQARSCVYDYGRDLVPVEVRISLELMQMRSLASLAWGKRRSLTPSSLLRLRITQITDVVTQSRWIRPSKSKSPKRSLRRNSSRVAEP